MQNDFKGRLKAAMARAREEAADEEKRQQEEEAWRKRVRQQAGQLAAEIYESTVLPGMAEVAATLGGHVSRAYSRIEQEGASCKVIVPHPGESDIVITIGLSARQQQLQAFAQTDIAGNWLHSESLNISYDNLDFRDYRNDIANWLERQMVQCATAAARRLS